MQNIETRKSRSRAGRQGELARILGLASAVLDVINGAEWGAVINGAVCEPYVFVIQTENGARSILSPLKSLLSSQEPGLLQNCSGSMLSILQWFKGEVVLRSFFFPQLKPVCFCVFLLFTFSWYCLHNPPPV